MTDRDELINETLEHIDFKKIRKTMKMLNWEWALSGGVPTKEDMRHTVISLINGLIDNRYHKTGTGGFYVEATYRPDGEIDMIRTYFVLEQWEAYND